MRRFTFAKNKRLVSNGQFKEVLDQGLRISDKVLTLYMAKNDFGYSRLGVSVGKFWGNSVVRNRLKRLLREAFRQSQDQLPAGFDYLLMISRNRGKPDKTGPKETIKQLTFERVRASLLALVNQVSGPNGRMVKQ
ncbi:MAG: ribonuclease P protein component [Planctomycetota bacterium]